MSTVEALVREATDRLHASGSPSARLDAELILGNVLGIERTTLLAHPEAPVGPEAEARFRTDLARRERGEPVAYIRGLKEFFGVAFGVDARALIPRPETERLVELAEAEIMRRLVSAPRPPGSPPLRVADVGTGSGAVAVALAHALGRRGVGDEFVIVATDISRDALQLARENAVGHAAADRIEFVEVDLLPAGVPPFDLVLANLPYVRSDVVPELPVAASFEPRLALDGGTDGLDVIRRLLDQLPDRLASRGEAMLEIGADQREAILEAVEQHLPGWTCRVETDLAGLPRVARISAAGPGAGDGGSAGGWRS